MVGSTSTLVLTTNLKGQDYRDLQKAALKWDIALKKPAVIVKHGPVSKDVKTPDKINSIQKGDLEGDKLGLTQVHTVTTTNPKKDTNIKKEIDIVLEPSEDRDVFMSAALHEIGHALGAEHITDTKAVMNPTIKMGDNSKPLIKLTHADIEAVKNANKGKHINYVA